MGTEIERKFLVTNPLWKKGAHGQRYRQGYLVADGERTVRVRVARDKGYLTIKGQTTGIRRAEFEYEIPLPDAEQLLDTLCRKPLIEKMRYRVEHHGLTWEVDEFTGENEGLVIAEVELKDEAQPLELPEWAGAEVSHDHRYSNASLSRYPYRLWKSS
jgi:CYTH domain-containing protein